VSRPWPLGALDAADLDRLLPIRALLEAPDASIVLASATRVEPTVAARPDVIAIEPADVYGELQRTQPGL
jgi:hypothetical protein